jgi:hypothetical protein
MSILSLTLNDSTKLYELGNGAPKSVYQFVWDFAVLGGAVGSIPLTQINGPLPNNFMIQNACLDVITGMTGDIGATGAVTSGQGANDLVVATVVAGAPFSTTGPKVTLPLLGTIATWVKTTAQRSPALVIAVNAFTAGKFNLWVEGVVSS